MALKTVSSPDHHRKGQTCYSMEYVIQFSLNSSEYIAALTPHQEPAEYFTHFTHNKCNFLKYTCIKSRQITVSLISSRLHNYSGTEATFTHLQIYSFCSQKGLCHEITPKKKKITKVGEKFLN